MATRLSAANASRSAAAAAYIDSAVLAIEDVGQRRVLCTVVHVRALDPGCQQQIERQVRPAALLILADAAYEVRQLESDRQVPGRSQRALPVGRRRRSVNVRQEVATTVALP